MLALAILPQLALAFLAQSPPAELGTISVERPAPIVRATVPLDPSLDWSAEGCPLVLKRADGSVLPTQWERVSLRGADASSVRVAEVLAFDAKCPAGPTTYAVARVESQPDLRVEPAAWAAALFAEPPPLQMNGDAMPLVWSSGELFRSGSVAATRRFQGPHVFGWVTAFHHQDVLAVDLVLHSAEPGQSDFLFDRFGFRVGTFEPAWPEPLLVGGELAPPRPDGHRHVVCQRAARWWSGVLHDGSKAALARALARGAGWGASDRWQEVAAWQPQAMPLPELGYRGAQLESKCKADWAEISSALATGSPFGMGVTYGGRLDIWHPWGPRYGGVTGGAFRFQWEGVAQVLCGEPDGLLELQARMRMVMDRHPVALVARDGSPQLLEDWLDTSGKPEGEWNVSDVDARFQERDGALAFSRRSIPAEVPPEYATLKVPIVGSTPAGAYAPIDWQHHDRATQMAVALVWASNHPVAGWWVRQNAENWRWSVFSKGRLASSLAQATNHPGQGSGMGRAHAHGWVLAAAAYAISGESWRARWNPYLDSYRVALLAAQMPENGLYRQHWKNKDAEAEPFGNGTTAHWSITRVTEESLLADSLFAVLGARDLQGEERADTLKSLLDWGREGLWRFAWNSGATGGAPTYTWGIRPLVWPGPVLGPPASDPAEIPRSHGDRSELASPLGMLLFAEPTDPVLQLIARKYCGDASSPAAALAWLKARTLSRLELDDSAPLHAALERVR